MEQTSPAVAAAPLPDRNPDFVIITCPMICELHGFVLNEQVPTKKRIIEARDKNGLDIRVLSLKWNYSLWLSSSEYSLVNTPGI